MSRFVPLADLNPRWFTVTLSDEGGTESRAGVQIDCPLEGCAKSFGDGPHPITFAVSGAPGAEEYRRHGYPVWDRHDNGGEDLSLLDISPSVRQRKPLGCGVHVLIKKGVVEILER